MRTVIHVLLVLVLTALAVLAAGSTLRGLRRPPGHREEGNPHGGHGQ